MKVSMKELRLLAVGVLVLLIALSLTSCDENPEAISQEQILPESFGVEIPSSINSAVINAGGRIDGKTENELSGDDIYSSLRLFIHVGAASRELIEEIIRGIREFPIEGVQVVAYESDDDGRSKLLEIFEDVEFEGNTWEYMLQITDLDAQNDPDEGIAMQVFWNNAPVEGIAIMKPYNIDRNDRENNAMYRIDYNSAGNADYDATMEVAIAGLRTDRQDDDDFVMRNLRMFVGRKGENVDVFGNSNHPRARLFPDEENPGFNWAFVASSNRVDDIGVAEVGLPPSSLDSDDREVLLDEYSIKNVFTTIILREFPNIPQPQLDAYLVNTTPPGYFEQRNGFLSAGLSPGAAWDPLEDRIEDLAPYNPLETTNLEISFK